MPLFLLPTNGSVRSEKNRSNTPFCIGAVTIILYGVLCPFCNAILLKVLPPLVRLSGVTCTKKQASKLTGCLQPGIGKINSKRVRVGYRKVKFEFLPGFGRYFCFAGFNGYFLIGARIVTPNRRTRCRHRI
jgi:hypothetical protein